jgi:hypothetical protein
MKVIYCFSGGLSSPPPAERAAPGQRVCAGLTNLVGPRGVACAPFQLVVVAAAAAAAASELFKKGREGTHPFTSLALWSPSCDGPDRAKQKKSCLVASFTSRAPSSPAPPSPHERPCNSSAAILVAAPLLSAAAARKRSTRKSGRKPEPDVGPGLWLSVSARPKISAPRGGTDEHTGWAQRARADSMSSETLGSEWRLRPAGPPRRLHYSHFGWPQMVPPIQECDRPYVVPASQPAGERVSE